MAMPPMLRSALSRLPIERDEKKRLEREELDAQGFVAKLERMLLAVDDSANGTFAAQLAGYLAGGKGMPATVLEIDNDRGGPAPPESSLHEEQIKQGAAEAAAATEKTEEEAPRSVEVTIQPKGDPSAPEQLAEWARKGFGFLFIGLADTRAPDGAFRERSASLPMRSQGRWPFWVPLRPDGAPEMGDSLLVPVDGERRCRQRSGSRHGNSTREQHKGNRNLRLRHAAARLE